IGCQDLLGGDAHGDSEGSGEGTVGSFDAEVLLGVGLAVEFSLAGDLEDVVLELDVDPILFQSGNLTGHDDRLLWFHDLRRWRPGSDTRTFLAKVASRERRLE